MQAFGVTDFGARRLLLLLALASSPPPLLDSPVVPRVESDCNGEVEVDWPLCEGPAVLIIHDSLLLKQGTAPSFDISVHHSHFVILDRQRARMIAPPGFPYHTRVAKNWAMVPLDLNRFSSRHLGTELEEEVNVCYLKR